MKLLLSILIVAAGLVCGLLYLAKPPLPSTDTAGPAFGDRPWRRLGAAICSLVSVMFVLGIYLVDRPINPQAFAAYWLIIMVLVLWMCGLAIKDILHTRRTVAQWRDAQRRTGH